MSLERLGSRFQMSEWGTFYDPVYITASFVLRHKVGRVEKVAALRKGLELGINLIDTAEIYKTEDIVAEAIKDHDREGLFLSTKVFGVILGTRVF